MSNIPERVKKCKRRGKEKEKRIRIIIISKVKRTQINNLSECQSFGEPIKKIEFYFALTKVPVGPPLIN